MPTDEGVPQTGSAILVSTTPDVCLTPLLPNAPTLLSPVFVATPYTIVGRFSNASGTAPLVRFNGFPTVTSKSFLTTVIGNEAGTGGGVVSGVNCGVCTPLTYSATVLSNGGNNVSHGSTFAMNCAGRGLPGNTVGKVIYVRGAGAFTSISPGGSIVGDTNPPVKAETQEEKGFLGQLWDVVSGAPGFAFDVGKGAVGGVVDIAAGTLGIAKWASDLSVGWVFNNEQAQKTWHDTSNVLGAMWNNPGAVPGWLWDGISAPYAKAIQEGHLGEAIGRAGVDIGSFFVPFLGPLKGLGKASEAGEAAEAAGKGASTVGRGGAAAGDAVEAGAGKGGAEVGEGAGPKPPKEPPKTPGPPVAKTPEPNTSGTSPPEPSGSPLEIPLFNPSAKFVKDDAGRILEIEKDASGKWKVIERDPTIYDDFSGGACIGRTGDFVGTFELLKEEGLLPKRPGVEGWEKARKAADFEGKIENHDWAEILDKNGRVVEVYDSTLTGNIESYINALKMLGREPSAKASEALAELLKEHPSPYFSPEEHRRYLTLLQELMNEYNGPGAGSGIRVTGGA